MESDPDGLRRQRHIIYPFPSPAGWSSVCAFAPYGMDGGRTERSEMASRIAVWANRPEQKDLWRAHPVCGDVHILFVPECETASYLLSQSGEEHMYPAALYGAYEGFYSQGIQADFVHIDDIEKARILYFPFPLALSKEHIKRLAEWVKEGGTLIAESCPGFFTDYMHANTVQPPPELEALFGVRQRNAEFMPDLAANVRFHLLGAEVRGGGFIQTYEPKGAGELARYGDAVISAQNRFGNGTAVIVGAAVSLGGENNHTFYGRLLEYLSVSLPIRVSDHAIQARLHLDGTRRVLWIVNPCRDERTVRISLRDGGQPGHLYWAGGQILLADENAIEATVRGRDALVLEVR